MKDMLCGCLMICAGLLVSILEIYLHACVNMWLILLPINRLMMIGAFVSSIHHICIGIYGID